MKHFWKFLTLCTQPLLQVVEVLSKHAGLWITRNKEIMYSQVCTGLPNLRLYGFTPRPLTSTSSVQWGSTTSHWTPRWAWLYCRTDFICNRYLQICQFQVGSYSYEMSKMTFTQSNKVQGWVKISNYLVLPLCVTVCHLAVSKAAADGDRELMLHIYQTDCENCNAVLNTQFRNEHNVALV